MNNFFLWFTTGLEHIAGSGGSDHILFLVALCAVYTPAQWKSLLVLVTAFTIGHSLTLALSVLRIIALSPGLVEFLIPLTIIFTCLHNLYYRNRIISGHFKVNYWMALGFGFIHGLGFSTMLRSLLGEGRRILSPLFAFNTGLEAGQLIIVGTILLFSLFLTEICRLQRKHFNVIVSSAVLIAALVMALQRFNELLH